MYDMNAGILQIALDAYIMHAMRITDGVSGGITAGHNTRGINKQRT